MSQITRALTTLSGSPISRFTFGTMQFAGRTDPIQSQAMFDACVDAGINHFDTAHVYTDGGSESLLGRFIKPIREQLIIATKVGYTGGATPDTIARQLDMSLQRLDQDMVDILYLHRFDPNTALEVTFEQLAKMKQQGRFRYIGLSNFAAWQIMKASAIAAGFDLRIDIIQPMYNLVKRQAEVEIFPMAMDQQITIAPYSPLGAGLLTGKYFGQGSGRLSDDKRYAARYGQDWMWQSAKALSDLAKTRATDPATLAAAWAAAHPANPHPILSARNITQLAPSLAALDFDMTPDLYARISALSPTPPPATDRLEEA